MTNKNKEIAESIYEDYNYTCFICDKRANQIAHLIGDTKTNRKQYGSIVVDSPLNKRPACGLEHNALLDVGHSSILSDQIYSLILSVQREEIDKLVKENIERKQNKSS